MSRVWRAPDGREYPIVEAEESAVFQITEEDVAHGIPHDPVNCAIAVHCRRVLGAPEAMIGAAWAYIVQEREGRMVAMRYRVPEYTRNLIDRFDQTGDMPTEGVKLLKVAPSGRLSYARERSNRYYARLRAKGGTKPHSKGGKPGQRTKKNPYPARSAANLFSTVEGE